MDYEELVDLFQANDVIYLSWTNELGEPRRLQNALLHFHGKDVCVRVPLTPEAAPTLVTLVQVLLEQRSCVLFTYDLKDLVVALRHATQGQGWQPRVEWPAKIFDLCYIERFAGAEAAPPQSLSQARARFKKHYDKRLFSIHRDIHIPLATRTIPRIESVPILKIGEGHLFCHYHIEGQTYGRLNCDKPATNYYTPHNLPKDDLLQPSKDGHVFLSFDYHAMEVAVLQKVSEDRRLGRILEQPDVYEAICRYLFECSREEAKGNRDLVKRVFLQVMYGMTPPGVSKALGVSYESGERIFRDIHEKFPQASGFMLEAESEASRAGVSEDCLGRRRAYPEDARPARNGKVQGPAAVHCQTKLIELSDAVAGMADVVASIHDAYLLSCHRFALKEVANVARSILESESSVLPGLKLRTRAATGQSLGSMEKYEYGDRSTSSTVQ